MYARSVQKSYRGKLRFPFEEGVSRMLLIRSETLERIAAEYGIEDDEMNEILKESKEDKERFKKEIKDAVMNVFKTIKIDITK